MKATLISFGYKSDMPAPRADEFLDVRTVRNPWGDRELRPLTGKHEAVQAFIQNEPQAKAIMGLARLALTKATKGVTPRIAFGCHGGKHRSVAIAELLAKELREEGWQIDVKHQQLDRDLAHA